jgi:hypothetical protein
LRYSKWLDIFWTALVPAELLKSETEKLCKSLRQIFYHCLNGEEIPNDWKIGYNSAIYKKG